ncbi:MAG TPA: bifunctional DNA-binding transcriptional regulator/O6-methylguanine-DNA methyltransferase Ada [Geminicoccus sp.]|uniref:bifunctional DNA-binding transcriptional regulator/O6-methylguanine-DNA methyltransferase Ada n=1 Tax=Geminicoccus sp. TaxID=2024832 RepID=UPI002E37FD48|nr:bifunctional DNA-binding transcriptional regulator/O6-methylguanine-DNA methyltransferase Ada [Geminicoccus sp.]HEX2529446.1 bifunctional DNA-binding transcriptional regulator/O6-methylguanine-DNA methyltransferase Ada [Geminicoccus sp.]
MHAPVKSFGTDDERWEAVAQRNPAADGMFLYAVQTTGVYCRPSCAARLANRVNVSFHATCQEAEAAGFRPCRRCRPSGEPLAKRQADAVLQACRLIETAEEMPQLDELARAANMSRFHFHRIFKARTGLTPKAYADAHRAERVRRQLQGKGRITDALYDAGFNSNGRFYAQSRKVLGMKPTDYRAGGTGTAICFAVAECTLGSILVAASGSGVCAILLGDDPDALVRDLQDRFPKADLGGGDAAFEEWVARIIRFVEAPRIGLDLPLDVRGTAFQQRVWRALSEIPPGSTASYTEIATKIGAPKAVRAVAMACAANNLAVVVPCHRVVRHDGNLSGYRWGAQRKLALLERERSA